LVQTNSMSVLTRTVVHLSLDVPSSLLHYVKDQSGAQHDAYLCYADILQFSPLDTSQQTVSLQG